MKGLGSAMAGSTMGTTERKRHPSDFYATPAEITYALLDSVWCPTSRDLWEPACGSMAMVNVQRDRGYNVVATDIDTGYDFLQQTELLAPSVMTNPPFKLAAEFIRKAFELRAEYLGLLLKMSYWNAASRLPLFEECQPSAVLPLTWRMDVTGQGAPTMDCAWYVWKPRRAMWHPTIFQPLTRPTAQGRLLEVPS